MIRSLLVVMAGILGGGLSFEHAATAAEKPAAKRPNILFIFTDDQSWRTLSCYRDDGAWPWVKTPNLDRLAHEGVRFRHAYGAAWCTPSRACVLTGLLPHGIQGLTITSTYEGNYDPAVCRFWPARLRQAGYHTGVIGKWHLTRDVGQGRDWDHSIVWHQGDFQGDVYNDQPLSIDGAAKKIFPGYSTDVYTRFAVDYIKADHRKPWLLWLCYNAPHMPNTIAPRHKERYAEAEVPIPTDVFGPRPDKPSHMNHFSQWQRGTGTNEGTPMYRVFTGTDKERLAQTEPQPLPRIVQDYNRLVCAVDEGVGRLRKTLEETGQLDNTVIVFTSDQGFAWGEHGFAWKVAPYDACLRVPFLIRLPGAAVRDAVCRQPVTVVDLPPTLLGLAKVPLPWTMHGRDLRPLLNDPQARWDHPVLMEHFRSAFGAQTNRVVTAKAPRGGVNFPWWIFLRQDKYKYIRTLVPDEIEELYDLEHDPQELKNLAVDKAHHELLAGYRQRMLDELKRTKAGLLEDLPAIRQ